ncbi:MAG: hypothetical protein AB7D51_07090 [Desulfovibrionaceae bacterium]
MTAPHCVDYTALIDATCMTHFRSIKQVLAEAYETYTSEVSEADMALSLEASAYLTALCLVTEPATALDLGSGFSSFALRRIKAEVLPNMEIVSVDTDAGWLQKSREFCLAYGLDGDNFLTWDQTGSLEASFDIISFDIDHPPARGSFLDHTLKHFVDPSTFLLIDDMHFPKYGIFVHDLLSGYNYAHVPCKHYTLDEYGRFATLVHSIY